MRRFALATLLLLAAPAAAQLPVFSGDPVDPATGQARVILPGVASVQPGEDEDFNSADDEIDAGLVGDVDLVVRTGGTFAGGAIPAPAAGVAAAPAVVAGGVHSGVGSEAAVQVILSNGAAIPPAGDPLTGAQHDGRAFLVLAYPDLDGDGIVGPTNADGSADNAVERQEALTIVGRQVGLLAAGVGAGNLGLSIAAPASAGGLGVVVTAAALMGNTAPKYFDGPWVGTLQPIMPPVDAEDVIGGGNGVRAPDPLEEYLVELELEYEKWFLPAPGHPVLGTPYAIPLDGSSVTVDLLRSESAPATAAGLAVAVDAATYVAAPERRLLPIVAAGGGREVVELVASRPLADDGPGNGASLRLYAADLLGNAGDPVAPLTVTLTATAGLAIVTPDGDADPLSETVTLSGAEAVIVAVDDDGGALDGPASSRLVASVDGVPTAFVDFPSTASVCGNGRVDAGEACDDGNTVDSDGCRSDCTLSTTHDTVLLAPKPLTLRLAGDEAERSKSLRIKVRNADRGEKPGHVVRLIAEDGDCPPGTITAGPDFDARTPGDQDSLLVAGGATKSAMLTVRVARADFTSPNAKTPSRCALALRVEADVPGGNTDPAPSNDAVPLEINVFDRGDAPQATAHESFLDSLKPIALRIAAGAADRSRSVKVTVTNADVVPVAEEPGHAMTVSTDDGTCPPGTLAAIDLDPAQAGAQQVVTLAGGRRARGPLVVNAESAAFLSRGSKSPARCVATLRVSGPGGDANGGNDVVRLVIDVVDGNDG